MDNSSAETSLISVGNDELLAECWSAKVLASPGDPLQQMLAATELLDVAPGGEGEEDDVESSSTLLTAGQKNLRSLVDLLRAERAFLFRIDGETAGNGESLDAECVISINLDGEAVPQPEKKVPLRVIQSVVTSGAPASHQAPSEEPSSPTTESYYLALPLEVNGQIKGVIFAENRFRPLVVSQDALLLCRVYCRILVTLLEMEHLRSENRTLWNDVTQLRESTVGQSPTPSSSPITYAPKQRAKGTKRSDLKGDYSMIVGNSPGMIEIFQVLDRISSSTAPVLINGESGTGKELIANAIHKNSPRATEAFVSENCGALTETLLESELFGYMKGAFTGATKDRKGLFELATGGTLFLDEVGDMSTSMQKKLLRVLQEKVVRRVGGKEFIPVDVRIISATNKDLLEEVRAGNFREDLYYRLNVINLKLPPLRDRKEDIPEIVEFYLGALACEYDGEKAIEDAAVRCLMEYEWPGNIRELQNEVKRLYALSDEEIRVSDLSETILRGNEEKPRLGNLESDLVQMTLREAVERVEEHLIRHALIHCRGNKSLVAKKLQVPKTSLYNKINKYGLNRL